MNWKTKQINRGTGIWQNHASKKILKIKKQNFHNQQEIEELE